MLTGHTDIFPGIFGGTWVPVTAFKYKMIEGGSSTECCMEILVGNGVGT